MLRMSWSVCTDILKRILSSTAEHEWWPRIDKNRYKNRQNPIPNRLTGLGHRSNRYRYVNLDPFSNRFEPIRYGYLPMNIPRLYNRLTGFERQKKSKIRLLSLRRNSLWRYCSRINIISKTYHINVWLKGFFV